MFPLKKTYQITISDANAALQNIFAACNQSPNTIPIDKLLLRQTAHTRAYDILLRVILVLLILTLLAPFVFLSYMPATSSTSIALEDSYTEGDKLYVDLATYNHTLHYEKAYLVSPNGTVYEVISYDEKTQILCFPNVAPDCSIYVPYNADQMLHLQLTTN